MGDESHSLMWEAVSGLGSLNTNPTVVPDTGAALAGLGPQDRAAGGSPIAFHGSALPENRLKKLRLASMPMKTDTPRDENTTADTVWKG